MSHAERIQELELDLIVSDDELKVRVEINQTTVQDYYDAMETEEDVKKFPKPTVYFDGCRYWLADGHHRYWAVKRRGYEKMAVKIIDGSHDDAILAAVTLNLQNGLRFQDGDWEKIIELITGKEQWKDWSNRKIAEELKCSYETVRRYRPDSVDTAVSTEKRRGRDGKMYKARKIRNPDTKPDTAPSSPPVATEPEQATNVAQTHDPAPAANECGVSERPISEPRPAHAEARAEQERILEDISALVTRINRWFDTAPAALHVEFDKVLRDRFEQIMN